MIYNKARDNSVFLLDSAQNGIVTAHFKILTQLREKVHYLWLVVYSHMVGSRGEGQVVMGSSGEGGVKG